MRTGIPAPTRRLAVVARTGRAAVTAYAVLHSVRKSFAVQSRLTIRNGTKRKQLDGGNSIRPGQAEKRCEYIAKA